MCDLEWFSQIQSHIHISIFHLTASVAANKQISKVILMLGKDSTPITYQTNAQYNTYARDDAFCNIYILNRLIFIRCMEVRQSLLYYCMYVLLVTLYIQYTVQLKRNVALTCKLL